MNGVVVAQNDLNDMESNIWFTSIFKPIRNT